MWLPLLAFLLGFSIFYIVGQAWLFDPNLSRYLAAAILAGADAVIGGIRARLDGKFDDGVFMSGFFVTVLLAAGLTYVGDALGVDLLLAVSVVFGKRIFDNLALIRRHLLALFHHSPATVAPMTEMELSQIAQDLAYLRQHTPPLAGQKEAGGA